MATSRNAARFGTTGKIWDTIWSFPYGNVMFIVPLGFLLGLLTYSATILGMVAFAIISQPYMDEKEPKPFWLFLWLLLWIMVGFYLPGIIRMNMTG